MLEGIPGMKFIAFIWSNLIRAPLRTVLTLASIAVAFVLFGYLCAVRQALGRPVGMPGSERLMVRHRISIAQLLPVRYGDRIRRIPGVAAVAHACWFGGVYQEPGNFFPQMAVEPEAWLAAFPEIVLSDEARHRWLSTRTGVIAGRSTAERFGWRVGDRIPLQGTIWLREDGERTWEFELCGIYEGNKPTADTSQFLMRYDYFDESRAFKHGETGWFLVRIDNPARAGEIARRIDSEFANSSAETKTEPEGAFVQAFANQIGNITAMVAGILGAVFFTILLVTANTMAQSVRERTEEVGVLKALGFSNGTVLILVLAESCLMALAGGGFGLGVAWIFISRGDPTHGALPMFGLVAIHLLLGLCLVLLLGVLAGAVPAWDAMRLRVADALRRA